MNLRRLAPLLGVFLTLVVLILPPGISLAAVPAPQTATGQAPDPYALPTNQIILKYKTPAALGGVMNPAGAAEMQRLSSAAGVPVSFEREMSGDAYVMALPSRMPLDEVQAIANRLSALPEVAYAEPDAIMVPMLTPNDPQYANQWHYFAPSAGNYGINAPAAWDITTGSPSIVVAVIDTGITNHADLSGRTVAGYDFIADSLVANDGGGRDSDPSDPGDWITAAESSSGYFAGCQVRNSSWHGTHVAGTIGAASNNSLGVAGINWNSKIQAVRVLGKCGGFTSDIVDGMRWAAGLAVAGAPSNATPAKVLNMSLGGSGACNATYQSAANDVVAAGSTLVVAAGNSNANASGYQPASCNGVITVAATNKAGSRSYYSNYGAVVEISAPGGETNVTSSNGVLSTLNTGTQGPVGDTYTYYQGTSMAAPHVAGVASLLYSRKPSLTPAEVLSYLQSTVTAFPGGSTCNTSICGSGIVNAGAAVAAIPTVPLTRKLYLPAILKGYPQIPAAPVLNAISNADGDGNYTVSWNTSASATGYLLQEDDNGAFSSPTNVYSGAGTSWNAASKPVGTYYYRAQASNTNGSSDWSNTQSATVAPVGAGWTTLASTDFEGTWPSPWSVYDNDGAANGEYHWGKRTCRAYSGSYSGWGVGAGAQGSGLGCGANYPNNADSWMTFGPFSLANTTAADLKFKLWLNSEMTYDRVCRFASVDGANYWGTCTSGNTGGWSDRVLDLANVYTLGNLLGQANVWVAIWFDSDSSVTYSEGGYVDDVTLRKCPSGNTCPAALIEETPNDSQVTETPAHIVLTK